MRFYGVRRRFVLWMASLAVLIGALLPSTAPSFAAARPSQPDWSQICSLHGPVQVSAADTTADGHRPAPGGGLLFEHCPYCSLHVAVLGMPRPAIDGAPLVVGFARHSAYIAAAPTLRLWSDALSRGPPVVPRS